MSTPDPFELLVEQRRQEALDRIRRLRMSVLLWGPTPTATSSVGLARAELRKALELDGHFVRYSEDLYDAKCDFSLVAQQMADVEAHDITFSLPSSPGSIAEAHDFARIPSIASRIVIFVDEEHKEGYANKTLLELESTATSRIQIYRASELPACVIEKSREVIRRLQELNYMLGRRC